MWTGDGFHDVSALAAVTCRRAVSVGDCLALVCRLTAAPGMSENGREQSERASPRAAIPRRRAPEKALALVVPGELRSLSRKC